MANPNVQKEISDLARLALAPLIAKTPAPITEAELNRVKAMAKEFDDNKSTSKKETTTVSKTQKTEQVSRSTSPVSPLAGLVDNKDGKHDVKVTTQTHGDQVTFKTGRPFIDTHITIQATRYQVGRGTLLLKLGGNMVVKPNERIVSFVSAAEMEDMILALVRARRHAFPEAELIRLG